MRGRIPALFFILIALIFVRPFLVRAAVLDSQLDDSAQATKPPDGYLWFGSVRVTMGNDVSMGYVPTQNINVYGVRFRVNTSGGGEYICPAGAVMRYTATSTPPTNWSGAPFIASLVSVSTTPDASGNCDYTTIDQHDNDTPILLSTGYHYIFFMSTSGMYGSSGWVSFSGKPFSPDTPLSLFGYRPAADDRYVWGQSGLDQPYFQFYDTAPPSSPKPSNVLFLPGIEGSRLYEGSGCTASGAEEKLWEPYSSIIGVLFGAGNTKVKKLFLDASGESLCDSVYVKENDIIDSAGGSNIYASFINEMNGLKASGEINDWKSVAYDWRLSLDDLLNKGAERDGKIFYEESTSTPYIEQTLRGLASSSKSGKVTIVAHSNGGLLAKALLNQLSGETPKLVDKVILVGAPQSGAPEDLGVLLEGYNAGIYKSIFTIVSNSTMQSLAKNSPTAYHLLPSANYFSSIASDTDHPVAKFEGQGYELERGTYGDTIKDVNTLDNYLRDAPQSMNGTLIDYANREHHTLDDWAPPSGIEVDQIAGWGADTVAGIDFYTRDFIGTLLNVSNQTYKPIFTEDGDGVVPVPSALAMPTNNEVKNYWVNLDAYHKDTSIKRSHADLFEVPQLEDFIKNIIESGSSTPAIPAYISNTQPAPIVASKELIFFLHSDQAIQVTDSSGDVTGVAPGNSIKEDIPDSSYGSFGEVKWVKVKEGDNYHISVEPQQHQQSEQNEGESEPTNTGFIHLDVEERSNNIVTASSTLARVAATASTTVATDVSGGGVETISTPVITGDDNNQNNQNNQNEVVHLYHYARP